MKNRSKLILILASFLSLFSACSRHGTGRSVRHLVKSWTGQYPKNKPTVTVWVHGSKAFSTFLTHYSNFFKSLHYNIDGLAHLDEYEPEHHAYNIAHYLHEADPEEFPLESSYFYGWSGALSYTARMEAAQNLFNELKVLREDYFDIYGVYPYLRIMTHSHGGNVVLHMAELIEDNPAFSIDELILLACPVQKRTSCLLKDHFYKKVISVYSASDTIQVADPQRWNERQAHKNGMFEEQLKTPIFSERRFPDHEKLVQIRVLFKHQRLFNLHRGPSHLEFLLETLLSNLPGIIKQAEFHACAHQQRNLVVRVDA